MIHAFNPAGRALCGRKQPKKGAPVTAVFYRDLCKECLREVTLLCRRLAP